MPRVGFEPTTLVIEREKAVHASGRTTTVIGIFETLHELHTR
jgi:hypothetical protein